MKNYNGMSKETDETLEKMAREVYEDYDNLTDESQNDAKLLCGQAAISFMKHYKPSYEIDTQLARHEFSIHSLRQIFEFIKTDIERGY